MANRGCSFVKSDHGDVIPSGTPTVPQQNEEKKGEDSEPSTQKFVVDWTGRKFPMW